LGATSGGVNAAERFELPTPAAEWLGPLAGGLFANQSASIVVVGESQPPMVHALAHVINHFLGNVGQTVSFTAPALADPVNQIQSLRELTEALTRDEVDLLIVLGGNPVFTAPADFEWEKNIGRAKMRL